jgi:hypothetical protein
METSVRRPHNRAAFHGADAKKDQCSINKAAKPAMVLMPSKISAVVTRM